MAKEPSKSRTPRKNAKAKTDSTDAKPDVTAEVIEAEVVSENQADEPAPKDAAPEPQPTDELTEAPKQEQAEEAPDPVETPASEPVSREPARQSVFLPMVLGGLVAGGIGYGVAYLQYADQQQAEPSATIADIESLRSEIAALPAPVDTTDLSEAITGLTENTSRIEEAVADLSIRVETVERQPSGDGTLPQTAVDAFEADMQALRDQIASQQAELQAVADQTAERLEATRAEAVAIETNAVEAARAATAKAALARIQGALETGAPFSGLLGELGTALDGDVPEALTAASDGIATLTTLQAEFPAVARAALSTARAEGVDGEESGGFGAFLRTQLDVRSVAPQEGDSVDAILSRAEAALREGRLNDTLAEIAALPEVARGAMSDWLALAETRAAAIDAADTLSNTLSDN